MQATLDNTTWHLSIINSFIEVDGLMSTNYLVPRLTIGMSLGFIPSTIAQCSDKLSKSKTLDNNEYCLSH